MLIIMIQVLNPGNVIKKIVLLISVLRQEILLKDCCFLDRTKKIVEWCKK